MPTTMTIYPYLFENSCWVFDDERTGLKEEAFVLGMTEMISRLVEYKLLPKASKGFSMTFAAEWSLAKRWLVGFAPLCSATSKRPPQRFS